MGEELIGLNSSEFLNLTSGFDSRPAGSEGAVDYAVNTVQI